MGVAEQVCLGLTRLRVQLEGATADEVDNAVLTFLITQAIAPAAFTTREVIVVRLSPELGAVAGLTRLSQFQCSSILEIGSPSRINAAHPRSPKALPTPRT